MTEQEQDRLQSKEFFTVNLKGRKFSVYDILGVASKELQTLKMALIVYDDTKPKGQKVISNLDFYLDPMIARVLVHQMVNDDLPAEGYLWDKGRNGLLRRFQIKFQEIKRGGKVGDGFLIYIAHGKSKKSNLIEVLDKSQELKEERIYLTKMEGLQLALAIQSRLQAWEMLRVCYSRSIGPYALDKYSKEENIDCAEKENKKEKETEKENFKEEKNNDKSVNFKCEKCGYEVDQKVVNYCKKPPFNGRILCIKCQKESN